MSWRNEYTRTRPSEIDLASSRPEVLGIEPSTAALASETGRSANPTDETLRVPLAAGGRVDLANRNAWFTEASTRSRGEESLSIPFRRLVEGVLEMTSFIPRYDARRRHDRS